MGASSGLLTFVFLFFFAWHLRLWGLAFRSRLVTVVSRRLIVRCGGRDLRSRYPKPIDIVDGVASVFFYTDAVEWVDCSKTGGSTCQSRRRVGESEYCMYCISGFYPMLPSSSLVSQDYHHHPKPRRRWLQILGSTPPPGLLKTRLFLVTPMSKLQHACT